MIEQFTKEDFENYLESNHSPFDPLGLVDGEYAYMLLLDNQTSITIRSSVKSNNLSADVGKDSIRCWLVSGDKPLGSKVSKWTTRQPGWGDRLNKSIKQLALWRALAGDCKECGQPKGIFKAKTEKNKGRPFTKCQEHGGFIWLDKSIKTSDIYFSEESHEKEVCTSPQCGQKDKQVRLSTNGDRKSEKERMDVIHDSALSTKETGEFPQNNREKTPNDQQKQAIESEDGHDTSKAIRTKSVSHKAGERTGNTLQNSDDNNLSNNANELHGDVTSLQNLREKTPNNQQKQAIEAGINTNLRVLAGPGSGKSKVIEWRYVYLVANGVNPDSIVVCTFGKQAATEIGQRIAKSCPAANLEQICTINALCYRLLAKWYPVSRWYKWRGPKDWQIKKTLEDIIGPIWQESEKPSAQEVYSFINTSKYLGLTTDDSYLWFVDTLGQQRGAWLYEIRSRLDAWLNRNRFLTFADQLFLVEQQLKNDSAWRAMVQEKFSHVIVDESQDCNFQAMRILVTIGLEVGQNTVYENFGE